MMWNCEEKLLKGVKSFIVPGSIAAQPLLFVELWLAICTITIYGWRLTYSLSDD
jgi:hypothetical protein